MINFAAIISKTRIMAAIDLSQFHELAEQFRGEMPLKKICDQEGVSYRAYIAWRSRNGLAPRRQRHTGSAGRMVEMEAVGDPVPAPTPKTTSVHIEFENGLKFDREVMEVDALIGFLTKIRGALCLG